MNQSLTITRMSAKNLFRFVDFDVNLGKITCFRGGNNEGKTSALRLAELAVNGSTNPYVIRQGADKGEVTIELSDGHTLRRTFTGEGRQYAKLTDSEGRIEPRTAAYIKSLLVENQFDPIAWLDLPAKEQIRILLQAIHVEITSAEVAEATGFEPPMTVNFNRHGLEVLAELREHVAGERKTENAIADRKRKAAAEMRAKLPAVKPVITEEQRDAVRKHIAEAQGVVDAIHSRRLEATNHARAVEHIQQHDGRLRAEHSNLEKEIADLETAIERKRQQQAEISLRRNQLVAEMQGLDKQAPPTEEEIAKARTAAEVALAEQRGIAELDKIILTFRSVEEIEAEADTASAQASIYDSAVKVLTHDLPRKLMAKAALPVGSISIDEDRILVDGKDLQYESTSNQMAISLAIARSLNPRLKVICIDRFESLDLERREAFAKSAAGDGYSYLVSEVDPNGGPLVTEVMSNEELAEVAQ